MISLPCFIIAMGTLIAWMIVGALAEAERPSPIEMAAVTTFVIVGSFVVAALNKIAASGVPIP